MFLRTLVLLTFMSNAADADWRLPDERYVPGYYSVFNVGESLSLPPIHVLR